MHKQGFWKKWTALCLALALLCTCAPFAAAQGAASFTGDVLMAFNGELKNRNRSFATDRVQEDADVAAAAAPDEAQERLLPDGSFPDPEPLSGPQALLRQAEVGDAAPQAAAEYRVGDTKRIYSHYAESEGKEYRRVDMVCTAVSETATVWRESGTENEKAELDEQIAAEMDVRVPQMLDFFGDKRIDTDGDGKIAVFLYKIDEAGVGGYFTTADLMDKVGRVGSVWHPILSASNHMDCIHVQGRYGFGETMETCLHEYQHYIEASYRFVGRNNFNALRATETFVNEGFSTSAEFLMAGVTHYAYAFAGYAVPSSGLSLLHWSDEYGNYALAFVFAQYIRTRYAAMTDDLDSEIPGGRIYKTILEMRTPKNDKDTLALIADLLYPAADHPDLRDTQARCRQLLYDFWTAVYCQEPTGVHGFNGESWTSRIDVRDLVKPMPAGDAEYPIRSGMAAFYQIVTNDTDTVRVTRSDEMLTFAVTPKKGYTLTFDANGGTGALAAKILREQYELWDVPLRSGCTFLGWSLSPDASSVRFNSGNTIRLTEDTTLYAVWEAAPTVVTDTEYPIRRQGGEDTNRYRFTPQADGVYKLTTPGQYVRSVYLDGEEIFPDWWYMDMGEEISYFSLSGGKTYELLIGNIWGDQAGTFVLTWQQTSFTLTYRFEHPLENDTWSKTGETVYTVDNAYPWGGIRFLGWAYTPDAEKPEVMPEQVLTLTKDTTLYAVCAPDDILPTDGSPAQATKDFNAFLYALHPEQDGMYEVLWTPDPQTRGDYSYATLYDARGGALLEVQPDTATACALRGGETYYLWGGTDSLIVTAVCKKTSDKIRSALQFSVGKNACFDLKLRGKTTYVIPDYTPVALDCRQFRGWFDEKTWEIYEPGDTITIAQDTVLEALWSSAPNTQDELLKAVGKLPGQLFRAFWKNLYLRIADLFAR